MPACNPGLTVRFAAVLVSDETLSAFARVLCNLKATFQLVDFYQMPDHRSWINEMAELTLKTFKISQNDAVRSGCGVCVLERAPP